MPKYLYEEVELMGWWLTWWGFGRFSRDEHVLSFCDIK